MVTLAMAIKAITLTSTRTHVVGVAVGPLCLEDTIEISQKEKQGAPCRLSSRAGQERLFIRLPLKSFLLHSCLLKLQPLKGRILYLKSASLGHQNPVCSSGPGPGPGIPILHGQWKRDTRYNRSWTLDRVSTGKEMTNHSYCRCLVRKIAPFYFLLFTFYFLYFLLVLL